MIKINLTVLLLLSILTVVAAAGNDFRCGCGPHLYDLTRTGFDTVYQVFGRPVHISANITEALDRVRWGVETETTLLQQRDIDAFRNSRIIETHLQNMDISFINKTLNGIQVYAQIVDNKSIILEGRHVNIRSGESPLVTVETRVYNNNISVCANVTGIPNPSVITRYRLLQRMYSLQQRPRFCAIVNRSTVEEDSKITFDISNCFGQVTVTAELAKNIGVNSSYSFTSQCFLINNRTSCSIAGITVAIQTFPRFQNCSTRIPVTRATNPPKRFSQPFNGQTSPLTSTASLDTNPSTATGRSIGSTTIGSSPKTMHRDSEAVTWSLSRSEKSTPQVISSGPTAIGTPKTTHRDSETVAQSLSRSEKPTPHGTSASSTQSWSSHTSNMVTDNRKDTGSTVIDSSPKVAIDFNVVTPRFGPSEEIISRENSESTTQSPSHTPRAAPLTQKSSPSSEEGLPPFVLAAIGATAIFILACILLFVCHRKRKARAAVTIPRHEDNMRLHENRGSNMVEEQFTVVTSPKTVHSCDELKLFNKCQCKNSEIHTKCSGYDVLEPVEHQYAHPVSQAKTPGRHSDGYDHLMLPEEEKPSSGKSEQSMPDISSGYAEVDQLRGPEKQDELGTKQNYKVESSEVCAQTLSDKVPVYATVDKSKKSVKRDCCNPIQEDTGLDNSVKSKLDKRLTSRDKVMCTELNTEEPKPKITDE